MIVWDEIIKVVAANGLWALLFVALLIYQLQDSRKRENKYLETIESLSRSLLIVKDIKKDITEIRLITIEGDKKCKPNRKEEISYES